MAAIEITGLDELIAGLGILATDQLPFATAKTLTQVAGIGKTNVIAEMQRVFDRPTSYTLNAFTIKSATKADLTSKVKLRDPSRGERHYLNPEAEGGRRHHKAFEGSLFYLGILPTGYYTVPAAGATIDAYGNMAKSQITQILSFFAGTLSDAQASRLARSTIRRYGYEYFAIQPGASTGLKPGIYMRIFSNFGTAIKPVLLYVRSTTYQQKLNVERIADETYDRNFNDLFRQNFIDAVNTAVPRR